MDKSVKIVLFGAGCFAFLRAAGAGSEFKLLFHQTTQHVHRHKINNQNEKGEL